MVRYCRYREMGCPQNEETFLSSYAQRKPLQQVERHNETWSMDFMSDAL
ncbi:MAG: hypothetical protein IPN10_08340 [Saprospiraceae bacterium]|nr:hypothetical protein [Saprospiraceae bacterium]